MFLGNKNMLIRLTIGLVIVGNLVLVVNILKINVVSHELRMSRIADAKKVNDIRSIMSDHGNGPVPYLSNATLEPGVSVLYPGSLSEQLATRVMLIRQRKIIAHENYEHERFTLGADACGGREIDLILFVTTPAEDFGARLKYRAKNNSSMLWMRRLKAVQFFIIGAWSKGNVSKIQKQIEAESQLYRDIVQGSFADSPEHGSLKTLSMLAWVAKNCYGAKFVVKTGHACDLNIPMVLSELNLARKKRHLFMLGRLATKDELNRMEKDPHSGIPYSVYKLEDYPKYLVGETVAYPIEVAALLFQAALRFPLFHLEDVFFTGICASFIKVPRLDNSALSFNDCRDVPKDKLL